MFSLYEPFWISVRWEVHGLDPEASATGAELWLAVMCVGQTEFDRGEN